MKYSIKTYRVTYVSDSDDPNFPGKDLSLNAAESVANVGRAIFATLDADREHFVVLFLNTKHRLKGMKVLHSGSISGAHVSVREVIKSALLVSASAIICLHNHPSGVVTPSVMDMSITKEIHQACILLDTPLLDHVILGAGKYYSMREKEDIWR